MMTDKPSAAWRIIRLPLGALLLSGVLLFTGLSALKTQAADWAAPKESGHEAPLQQTAPYDFIITKTRFPDQFTVGSNNRFIIRVTAPITVTGYDQVVTVQDTLPTGMTWTPANSGLRDCALSTTTQVNCIYST